MKSVINGSSKANKTEGINKRHILQNSLVEGLLKRRAVLMCSSSKNNLMIKFILKIGDGVSHLIKIGSRRPKNLRS